MKSELTIRTAHRSEIDWVNKCYDEIHFIHSNFDNEIIAIAELNGEKTGVSRLIKIDEKTLELGGTYVFPAFRNKGIAKELVQFLLSHVKPFQTVYCIPCDNLLPLLKRSGFKECSDLTLVPPKTLNKYQKYQESMPLLIFKKYSVENVSSTSAEEMIRFLKKHEDYSLFLLNNYETYKSLSNAPFSGNFKLIRSSGKIVAVFSLTRQGSLIITSEEGEDIFETVLQACQQEPMPIKAVIGEWDFCKPFWEFIKRKNLIHKENLTTKEILYEVDLQNITFSPQPNVKLLTKPDCEQWKKLRIDFMNEERMPIDFTDEQLTDLFLHKINKKIAWGSFVNNTLVSMADLNAKALDLGQVGGVYTKPEFRQKGHSKAVMKQLLQDSKELHKIRKLIIFTEENNIPAKKLYESLGAIHIGYFALLFGESMK